MQKGENVKKIFHEKIVIIIARLSALTHIVSGLSDMCCYIISSRSIACSASENTSSLRKETFGTKFSHRVPT